MNFFKYQAPKYQATKTGKVTQKGVLKIGCFVVVMGH